MDGIDIGPDEEVVVVYDAPDQVTAELVCATLRACGVRAVLKNPYASPAAGNLPHLALAWGPGVVVPAAEANAARAILEAGEPAEADFEAALRADSTTLDEAESNIK